MVWLLVGWVAVRLWAFFLLGFRLAACFPYGWLVRQLGGLSPIFPFPFPLESLSLHGFWSGFCRGSPLRVVSSCSFLEGSLPPLWRWRVWMVESSRPMRSSGRFPLVPVCFYPLPLLRYTGAFRRPRCACLGLRPFGKCVWPCLRKVPWNRPRSWCWLSIRLSSW